MKKVFIVLSILAITSTLSVKSYSLKESSLHISHIAKNSSEIVVAKCISSESVFDEKTGFVYTYTTFKIEQNLKNTITGDVIKIRVVGGQDGDIRTDVQGLEKFDINQEMVLFLGPQNRKGFHTLSSVISGSFKIKVNDKTGRKYIENPPPDMYSSPDRQLGKETEGVIYLDDFMNTLKNIKQ